MTAHPAPARSNVALSALWFGLFGGPAAWTVQVLVNLPVASHGCFPRLRPLGIPVVGGLRGITFVVSLLALVACAAALLTAGRSWVRTREEHQAAAGAARGHPAATALAETGEGRTRFMALSGLLLSLVFLLLILVNTASIFMVSPCAT